MNNIKTKYIFVTGGVVSSLGKGIASASLGAILKSRNLNITIIKFDPYLNMDCGTMNPFQHGEVFVTHDGSETDLDLGHYERFVDIQMSKLNNITAGQIYDAVLKKERHGAYLGATVQVIPHIIDEIKDRIIAASYGFDMSIIEIGGTVGDIESLPFLEAVRQMRIDFGVDYTLFMHLTLLPYIATSGELKTKPTQHSVKELRSIGIQPDVLLCRSSQVLSKNERDKIALFTNVHSSAVISCIDMPSVLTIPIELVNQGLDRIILEKLRINANLPDLTKWQEILNKLQVANKSTYNIKIAIVGKYVNFSDAYKSLNEALIHAGIVNLIKLDIVYINSELLEVPEAMQFELLNDVDGIVVPGGFGKRGIEGKIKACEFARQRNIPFLGICLGMQVAVIEFARNVLNLTAANSTEFDPFTKHPVIALVTEWLNNDGIVEKRTEGTDNLGGSMRLGTQKSILTPNSLIRQIYGADEILERHRHRFEVNEKYIEQLQQAGLLITGRSIDHLVEIVEIPKHQWFIGCQFHPELTSKPSTGHVLFNDFIKAAIHFNIAKSHNKYSVAY